jgi:hypothetical protein
VTSSWGVPLMPFKMYKVDDGTGEITVLSRGGNRTPSRGSHVQVKGSFATWPCSTACRSGSTSRRETWIYEETSQSKEMRAESLEISSLFALRSVMP